MVWQKLGLLLIKLYHLLKSKKVRWFLGIIQYAFILIILWYLFGLAEKIDASNFSLSLLSLSVVSTILLRVVSIYRLRSLVQLFFAMPFRELWKAQAMAQLIGLFTPGKAGEGMVVWWLGNNKQEKVRVASIFGFSKLLDGLVYVPFGLLFVVLYKTYVISVLLILGLFLFMLFAYTKLNVVFEIKSKDLMIPSVYVFTLFSLIFQVAGLYFVLLAKGVSVSFFLTALIWSIASMVALLSMFPGGIGVREAGISFLLAQFLGLEMSTAVAISLVHGFLLYATTLLFALGSRVVISWMKKK